MAFDVITPEKLGRGQLAVSPTLTTVYTTPAARRTIVKTLDMCNTTTGAITVSVYLVESGGTAGAANKLVSNITLPANGYYQWTGAQVLHAGDTIQASSSAVGITINISGGVCE